jgi:hypothetical protein
MEAQTDIDSRLASKDWRIGHCYHIVDKHGQLVLFKRNDVQEDFNKTKARRNIILKSRQLGMTTDACIDMLDDAIFRKNFNGVIIAHDEESLKRIFEKVKVAWNHFDKELKAILGVDTEKLTDSEIKFNNGSRLAVTLSSRSDTVHRLHISEFGKICAKYPHKAREIITGAIPSVPPDGEITIESTAEGEDGDFYEMFWAAWERGCEPRNHEEYKAFFYGWTHDKGLEAPPLVLPAASVEYQHRHKLSSRQMTWYYLRELSLKKLMRQEYPTTPQEAFVSSGRKVFDADIIERYFAVLKDKREKGEWRADVVGDWTYFLPYRPGHRYAMGVDVSEGVGLDSSACIIIDFSAKTPIIVARYVSKHITPELLPYEVVSGAKAYGNCLVAVERNNHGHTTLTVLRDMYFNIYSEVRKDRLTDEETERIGWLSTKTSKPRIMFNLKSAVEEEELDITDEMVLREARKFDHADVPVLKLDEETTRHFDALMATAIAYEMKDYVGMGGDVRMVSEPLTNPHRIMQ